MNMARIDIKEFTFTKMFTWNLSIVCLFIQDSNEAVVYLL